MKKFFTLFAAALVVLSASAAPVKMAKAEKAFAPVSHRVLDQKVAVKHAPAATQDITFTITVSNITATGAVVNVTPSDNNAPYYWDVMYKSDYDNLIAGNYATYGLYTVADFANYMIEDAAYGYGVDAATYLTYMAVQGADSYTFTSLPSNTELLVYAVALDVNYSCIEPASIEFFTTDAVQQSNNVITITYDANAQAVNFNATNNDPYFTWIELKSEYDAYYPDLTDASLLGEMGDWVYTIEDYGYSVDAWIMAGTQVSPLDEWFETVEDGEYIALAAPYAGEFNGAPAYCIFTVGATAVENVEVVKAQKTIENGQLVILKNGVRYNAQGAQL